MLFVDNDVKFRTFEYRLLKIYLTPIKLNPVKLHSQQLVAEALVLMQKDEAMNWPVYRNEQVIGKISYRELMTFLNQKENKENLYTHKLNFNLGTALVAIREMKTDRFKQPKLAISKNIIISFSSVAAVITVLLGLTWLFFNQEAPPQAVESPASFPSDKVALIMGSGERILLDNARTGVVIHKGKLSYHDGGAIKGADSYTKKLASAHAVGLTVHTPRGGQYQITLPDGTKVWLNAITKLTFPSNFAGLAERRVQLNGEAFFEVAKLKSKTDGRLRRIPFIVESKGQEIEVLGTHFDVRAYSNEPDVKTTLLEGSVRVTPSVRNKQINSMDPSLIDPMRINSVHSGNYYLKTSQAVLLKPNQQAILTGSAITIKNINTEEVIAWKNGEFAFRNMRLENVMHIVACWYDIEVVYQQQPQNNALLGGTIAKTKDIAEVLDMLEVIANVRFKVEGKKVTVIQ